MPGWRWMRDGEQSASINIRAHADRLELSYRWSPAGEPRDVLQTVPIERAPCRFGGVRDWLLCTDCNQRRAALYGVDRYGRFSCRVCMRLAYSSEAEDPVSRTWRAQRKLEARLFDDGSRPPGMRQRTYGRICERLDAIEAHRYTVTEPGLLRLLARLASK